MELKDFCKIMELLDSKKGDGATGCIWFLRSRNRYYYKIPGYKPQDKAPNYNM